MDKVKFCWGHGPGEIATGLIKLESNSVVKPRSENEHFPDQVVMPPQQHEHFPDQVVMPPQQFEHLHDPVVPPHQPNEHLSDSDLNIKCNDDEKTQYFQGIKSPSASTGQSGTCDNHENSRVDDTITNPCSSSPICGTPICRQFWQAGVYNEELTSVSNIQAGSRINIHPKFLHTNATAHKWAFGAIAELLDNAVDEIQNGAKYVCVDKILNPRDASPALLIQDDGAGMDPEAIRRCLSFGFSDKKSKSAIGKYGNGFKTSSMRLGADAIVFSRNLVGSHSTQSIGLLSYTFLTQSNYDRIVVPMVHYGLNFATGCYEPLNQDPSDQNLSVLLKWSPYSTMKDLLQQFDDIGYSGTKIIIFNLWLDDEGNMELDFDSDPKDILIRSHEKSKAKEHSFKGISENHIANRHRFSLRAYLSILYLKLPETFCISLRQEVVLYYNIATDLKYPEFIQYKAHSGGSVEGSVFTTIGFLKEAPDVKVHGFSIYHKSRLILPFLTVVDSRNNKGRGVVGVLEANFIQPTHNKQDFEKTPLYQKLVNRLREMSNEYWEYHCGLIGYKTTTKRARAKLDSANFTSPSEPSRKTVNIGCSKSAPVVTNVNSMAALTAEYTYGSNLKRKLPDQSEREILTADTCVPNSGANMSQNQRTINLMQQNTKLHHDCLELEKSEEQLKLKVTQLKTELEEAQREYSSLLKELQFLENANWRHVYM